MSNSRYLRRFRPKVINPPAGAPTGILGPSVVSPDGVSVPGASSGGGGDISQVNFDDEIFEFDIDTPIVTFEPVERSNIFLAWTQPYEADEFNIRYLVSRYLKSLSGWTTPGPDITTSIDVGFVNSSVATHKSDNGVLHLLYILDNGSLVYRSYNGTSWTNALFIDEVTGRFETIGIDSYSNSVYIFYIDSIGVAKVYSVDDESYVSLAVSTISLPTDFNIFGQSNEKPFLISSTGVMYVLLDIGYLVLLISTNFGSSWSQVIYEVDTESGPFAIPSPAQKSIVEDLQGEIFIVCTRQPSSGDRELITFNISDDVAEVIFSYEGLIEGVNFIIDSLNSQHIIYQPFEALPDEFSSWGTRFTEDFSDTTTGGFPTFLHRRDYFPVFPDTPVPPTIAVTESNELFIGRPGVVPNSIVVLEWLTPPSTYEYASYTIDAIPSSLKSGLFFSSMVGLVFNWLPADTWVNTSGYVIGVSGKAPGVMFIYKKVAGIVNLILLKRGYALPIVGQLFPLRFTVGITEMEDKLHIEVSQSSLPYVWRFGVTDFTTPILASDSRVYGLIAQGSRNLPDISGAISYMDVIDRSDIVRQPDLRENLVHMQRIGGNWVSNEIDTDGKFPTSYELIASKDGDSIVLAFCDSSNQEIIFGRYSEGDWDVETIVSVFPAIGSTPILGLFDVGG